jgi:YebC/PmpR family DNA-binding regulatory protein
MSGHSKWHSIKHSKGAADQKRAKVFARLARQIEVTARQGGGDVDSNPSLRLMVQKARDASMPKDNIDRAIKRGTGEIAGVSYESINYEGYAPHGVALYVETLSDNRNRTGAEIRSIFSKSGGSLAEPGAVAWQFERRGAIEVPKDSISEDDLMLTALDAGALDINDNGDTFQVVTPAAEFTHVKSALEEAGITIASHDLTMLATTTIAIDNADHARAILKVIDALEDHDDVQNVFANCDIDNAVLESL